MPELPEVETIARSLRAVVSGDRIIRMEIRSTHLMKEASEPIAGIEGAVITGVRRREKLLLMDFDNGLSLIFHLKMTGQFKILKGEEIPDKHVHLIFFLYSGRRIFFRDVRKFGYCLCRPTETLALCPPVSHLGAEPLELTEHRFKILISGKKGRIKSLLLNQSFLAGIGNIYADEILFRARIHPLYNAQSLSQRKKAHLYAAMREVLSEAVELGGSTIRDFKDSEGRSGDFQTEHRVYGRAGQACRCGRVLIRRITVAGRTTHFCPRCQRQR